MSCFLLLTSGVISSPQFSSTPVVESIVRASESGLTYDVITATYQSQAFPMLPGQTIFTKPDETPLPMPPISDKPGEGAYAILSFVGSMVDDQKQQVPLSRVYTHHWIMVQHSHKNELCRNGLNYVFGIGAESRNSPVEFPAGYGYTVSSAKDNQFGGNIHILRTEHLAEDAVGMVPVGQGGAAGAAKQCNECYYALGKGKECTLEQNGTFFCCGDNCYDGSCRCPTKAGTPMVPVNFYLQYTVQYTRDVFKIAPVSVGVITTPDCKTYYTVLRDDIEKESLSATTFSVPADMEIFLAIGHQHTGAINVSLSLNGKLFCTSYPTYGNGTAAGNEANHLVSMSTCYRYDPSGPAPPLAVKKGDRISVSGYYYVGSDDPRLGADLSGTHLNVMTYMYLGFNMDTSSAQGLTRAARPF